MTQREFGIEYQRLYMPLCMYALRMLGDVDQSRDVVQEAFASVWKHVGGSDMAAIELRKYMYRAVRNQALMFLRSLRENVSIDDAVDEFVDVSDEVMDTSVLDAAVWRAVENLPERCREIFLMSKRDGLTYSEIAVDLGLSVKTVENQISKALKSLRSTLASHPGKVFFLPFL